MFECRLYRLSAQSHAQRGDAIAGSSLRMSGERVQREATTAPTNAPMMALKRPPPVATPRKQNSHPPIREPMAPTKMLPTRPASQPAMAPTSSHKKIVSADLVLLRKTSDARDGARNTSRRRYERMRVGHSGPASFICRGWRMSGNGRRVCRSGGISGSGIFRFRLYCLLRNAGEGRAGKSSPSVARGCYVLH